MDTFMPLQPHVSLGLMRRKIVEDDMDFAFRIGGDDLVHEIEEFDAPASFVMAADDFATRKIEGGEQRRRPMPLIIVRLAGRERWPFRAVPCRARRSRPPCREFGVVVGGQLKFRKAIVEKLGLIRAAARSRPTVEFKTSLLRRAGLLTIT
jgi:hypothetical protein